MVIRTRDRYRPGHARRADGDGTPDDGPSRIDGAALVAYLERGAVFVLAVLVVVAGAGLYGSLGSIIDMWVASRYQPIARAAVDLAVLCVSVGGVLALLRRT